MTAAPFPNIIEALAHWHTADRAELRSAIVPPCDALGDEIYDVALAVVFRDVAALPTATERAARIETAIAVNRPQLNALALQNRAVQPEAPEAHRRLGAAVAVLERWQAAILDDAARQHIEGEQAA